MVASLGEGGGRVSPIRLNETLVASGQQISEMVNDKNLIYASRCLMRIDHKHYRLCYLNCHAYQPQQLKLTNSAAIKLRSDCTCSNSV